jgi:hypothetical protein
MQTQMASTQNDRYKAITLVVLQGGGTETVLLRASANGKGKIGQLQFRNDAANAPHDWLIVHDDLSNPISTQAPVSRRILFLSEPSEVKFYHPRYVSQFGVIAGPPLQPVPQSSLILMQPAIPWFYGIDFGNLREPLSFDELVDLKKGDKIDAVSVVISKKARTREHRARLRLVEYLATRLGDRLHIYGRDFKPIGDKREAIDGYKYHLALENNVMPHFWTEKLADAWLGWSLPFYAGCPNLNDYFPDESYIRIDYGNPERSAAIITDAIESNAFERALPAIESARNLVLHEHSLLAASARIIKACAPHTLAPPLSEPEVIYPNTHFRWRKKWSKKLRSLFKRKQIKKDFSLHKI